MVVKIFERPGWLVIEDREDGSRMVVDLNLRRVEKLRRRVLAWCKMVSWYQKDNPKSSELLFVGLTYRDVKSYQPGQIKAYVKELKRRMGAGLLAFAWVAELQKRGAVHYHLMVLVRHGKRMPLPDKSGMWPFGSSSVKLCDNPYALLYYEKEDYQRDIGKLPKGCRSYGVSIRFGGQETRDLYRIMSGIIEEKELRSKESRYRYVGTAMQKGYAMWLASGKL